MRGMVATRSEPETGNRCLSLQIGVQMDLGHGLGHIPVTV